MPDTSPEPLKEHFQVFAKTDRIQEESGNEFCLFIADSEEEALEKVFNIEGAHTFQTSYSEHFEEQPAFTDDTNIGKLKSGEFIRYREYSPNRYVNFDRTYSLPEIIAQIEAGDLDLNPTMTARLQGELNAIEFIKNILATDNAEAQAPNPAFLIQEELFTFPPEYNEEDRLYRRVIRLNEGEKAYDSNANQIWPQPTPAPAP